VCYVSYVTIMLLIHVKLFMLRAKIVQILYIINVQTRVALL